jgi:hypothetical protein
MGKQETFWRQTMFLILLIDIVYWLVVVTGLVFALTWKGSKRWRLLLGVASLVVLALGLPISSMLWPPDWMVPVSSIRASATLNGYAMSYVQKPGIDFYMDTLEIKGSNGKAAVVHVNVDNGKCWFGWAEASDKVVEFHCFPWGRMASVNAAWLEQNMALCRTDRCDLSVPYYAQR